MRIGSNFTTLDAAGRLGFVYTYKSNRSAARSIFDTCVANGQTNARVPLFIWAAEENYVPDGFTLGMYGTTLDGATTANLEQLLTDLKSAGFTGIEVGYGPAGRTLSPRNWDSLAGNWIRGANFVYWLRELVKAAGFPTHSIDLGEFLADPGTVVGQYASTMWSWYTDAIGSDPKDAHFGVTESVDDCRWFPLIARGADQAGPPNWFDKIQLHVYGNSQWRCTYETVSGLLAELSLNNVPTSLPVEIGETYGFADLTNVTEIVRAIHDSADWTFTGINQWPNCRSAASEDVSTAPCTFGVPAYILQAA